MHVLSSESRPPVSPATLVVKGSSASYSGGMKLSASIKPTFRCSLLRCSLRRSLVFPLVPIGVIPDWGGESYSRLFRRQGPGRKFLSRVGFRRADLSITPTRTQMFGEWRGSPRLFSGAACKTIQGHKCSPWRRWPAGQIAGAPAALGAARSEPPAAPPEGDEPLPQHPSQGCGDERQHDDVLEHRRHLPLPPLRLCEPDPPDLVHPERHDVGQPVHVDQHEQRPAPTVRFPLHDRERAHALHG